MRILVAEDDRKAASFLRQALSEEGYAVDLTHDGDATLAQALATSYEIVVLDIMLPGRDGLSVLRQLRLNSSRVPVLLVSARGRVEERIEGLNAGADDYLSKPFALGELVARVRSLCRRSDARGAVVLRLAGLEVDTVKHSVRRDGSVVELTVREYRLLEYLLRNSSQICGRMQLLEEVWEYDFDPGTNLVDVYVRRLRNKLDAGPGPRLLHTIRGIGYVLKVQA